MATLCKLYRNTPFVVPPEEWTLLKFAEALRNDRSMARDLSLIVPPENGDFIWGRNVRWESLTIPEGDERQRQFMARFVRDPHGVRDDTGAEDQADTPGRDWDTNVWLFKGYEGVPIGVEVWHDHHTDAVVGHAQFVGQTNDY